MAGELTERYRELLDGCYDCVDRIVLNAYNTLCYSAAGFRHWWRRFMNGSDEHLDNTHLMRLAGRFSRRIRGFARAPGPGVRAVDLFGVPVLRTGYPGAGAD